MENKTGSIHLWILSLAQYLALCRFLINSHGINVKKKKVVQIFAPSGSTVSPLHTNLQVANFQRFEHVFHHHQAWVKLQLALHLLLLRILQLYPLPPPLPPPVSNSSCLFTWCQPLYASCCTVLLYSSFYKIFIIFCLHHAACGFFIAWPGIEPVPPAVEVQSLNHWTAREVPCTTVLFKVLYCKNKNVYFLCLFFMYYLCEKYYKLITVQYYVADCVSWVPRLTLLDLWTNWTYKCTLGTELICM